MLKTIVNRKNNCWLLFLAFLKKFEEKFAQTKLIIILFIKYFALIKTFRARTQDSQECDKYWILLRIYSSLCDKLMKRIALLTLDFYKLLIYKKLW
jgi:hypothetical protein